MFIYSDLKLRMTVEVYAHQLRTPAAGNPRAPDFGSFIDRVVEDGIDPNAMVDSDDPEDPINEQTIEEALTMDDPLRILIALEESGDAHTLADALSAYLNERRNIK